MSGITLKQLNEFAKNAGVSQDAIICTCGADVNFMVASRVADNGEIKEYINLDEYYIGRDDVVTHPKIKVLRLWDKEEGESSDYNYCKRCEYYHSGGTRNPDTGYCRFNGEEVDWDDECEDFE